MSQLIEEGESLNKPQPLNRKYSITKLNSEGSISQTFAGKRRSDSQKCCIRTLKTTTNEFQNHKTLGKNLFAQEALALSLCNSRRSPILIENFRMKGDSMEYTFKPNSTLHSHMPSSEQDAVCKLNFEKMIADLTQDIFFLNDKMNFQNFNLSRENIGYCGENQSYFINDWASEFFQDKTERLSETPNSLAKTQKLRQNLKELGFLALELSGISKEELQKLKEIKNYNEKSEGDLLESTLSKLNSKVLQQFIRALLTK